MSNACQSPPSTKPQRLALLGICVGALLATSGILQPTAELNPSWAASINGEPLLLAEFADVLGTIEAEQAEPSAPLQQQTILDQLINERLMIQQGINSGLVDSDSLVRSTLVKAVIDRVTAQANAEGYSDEQLLDFYQTNIRYFTPPSSLHLQQLSYFGEDAEQQAHSAWRRLEDGEDFSAVKQTSAVPIVKLPNQPLPMRALRAYLGKSLMAEALSLETGAYSRPLASSGGWYILQLQARQNASAPPLSQVRKQVANEYRRREAEQALVAYIRQLREDAEISQRPLADIFSSRST